MNPNASIQYIIVQQQLNRPVMRFRPPGLPLKLA